MNENPNAPFRDSTAKEAHAAKMRERNIGNILRREAALDYWAGMLPATKAKEVARRRAKRKV